MRSRVFSYWGLGNNTNLGDIIITPFIYAKKIPDEPRKGHYLGENTEKHWILARNSLFLGEKQQISGLFKGFRVNLRPFQ